MRGREMEIAHTENPKLQSNHLSGGSWPLQRSSVRYMSLLWCQRVPVSWPLGSLCPDRPLLFFSSSDFYSSRCLCCTLGVSSIRRLLENSCIGNPCGCIIFFLKSQCKFHFSSIIGECSTERLSLGASFACFSVSGNSGLILCFWEWWTRRDHFLVLWGTSSSSISLLVNPGNSSKVS